MNRKPLLAVFVVFLLVFAALVPCAAADDTHEASTMRLLRYEGDV